MYVPVEEALKILNELIDNSEMENLDKNQLKKLIKLIKYDHIFQFNENISKLSLDQPNGSSISPMLASMYMHNIGGNNIKTNNKNIKKPRQRYL